MDIQMASSRQLLSLLAGTSIGVMAVVADGVASRSASPAGGDCDNPNISFSGELEYGSSTDDILLDWEITSSESCDDNVVVIIGTDGTDYNQCNGDCGQLPVTGGLRVAPPSGGWTFPVNYCLGIAHDSHQPYLWFTSNCDAFIEAPSTPTSAASLEHHRSDDNGYAERDSVQRGLYRH